jgi:hypothetical protein
LLEKGIAHILVMGWRLPYPRVLGCAVGLAICAMLSIGLVHKRLQGIIDQGRRSMGHKNAVILTLAESGNYNSRAKW